MAVPPPSGPQMLWKLKTSMFIMDFWSQLSVRASGRSSELQKISKIGKVFRHVTLSRSCFCHFIKFWSTTVTLMLNTSFKYNLEHRIFTFSVPTWRLCCNSGGKRTDETQSGFIWRCETMIGSSLTPGLYCQRRSLPPTILSDTRLHIHQARWHELAGDSAAQTRIPACNLASNMKESSINAAPPHIHLAVQFPRTFWIFPPAAVGIFRYNQRCCKARIYVPAASLLWQSWKWKSINNGVSVVAAGAPFSYLCWLFFEKRPKRESEKERGRRAVASAAICCFTFQIMSCDRANVLLQSAKQYAEPCRSVSPAKCQNVTERFIAGQAEKVASPFFQGMYISCNDVCSDSHKSSPTTLLSMETDAAWFFLTPPTHNAWRWIGFQHREKSVRNPEKSCGWERIHFSTHFNIKR